jgi:hypothetical protein
VAAAASVADVLDDDRGVRGRLVRVEQPGPDRVAGVSGEGDVVDGGVPGGALHRLERRLGGVLAGRPQLAGPELVEVGGLGDFG